MLVEAAENVSAHVSADEHTGDTKAAVSHLLLFIFPLLSEHEQMSGQYLYLWHLPAGGAGGKGVWGRSGEVYEPVEVDKKDPNFDEDQVITFAFRTIV